ncbi:MAG: imidazolonepropionase [Gemmatimonadota bacterium]
MNGTLLINAVEIVDGVSGVLRDCALALRDGIVSDIGPQQAVIARNPGAQLADCARQVLTPGFVDSHTHAVFGGWRAAEYEMRCQGLDYMEIARRGGGINASVREVRSRSVEELVELALPRLQLALRHGTTTMEVKSGYGLSLPDELKLLRVVRQLSEYTVLDVVPTFLGAHDVPLEYRDQRADYVNLVTNEMIPAVAREKLAIFCDVFMEPGAFTAHEARTILEAGKQHGLLPKLHADEFENSGAAELAAALSAVSADHLGAISDAGIRALAASGTVATLLPATLFFLGRKQYAPARRLIEAGVTVALATDFNPGTAPSVSMPLVLTLACSQMQMTPLEALVAATAGGARALRLDHAGVLKAGAKGDVVAWNVASHVEIPYRFGTPPVAAVWKAGNRII